MLSFVLTSLLLSASGFQDIAETFDPVAYEDRSELIDFFDEVSASLFDSCLKGTASPNTWLELEPILSDQTDEQIHRWLQQESSEERRYLADEWLFYRKLKTQLVEISERKEREIKEWIDSIKVEAEAHKQKINQLHKLLFETRKLQALSARIAYENESNGVQEPGTSEYQLWMEVSERAWISFEQSVAKKQELSEYAEAIAFEALRKASSAAKADDPRPFIILIESFYESAREAGWSKGQIRQIISYLESADAEIGVSVDTIVSRCIEVINNAILPGEHPLRAEQDWKYNYVIVVWGNFAHLIGALRSEEILSTYFKDEENYPKRHQRVVLLKALDINRIRAETALASSVIRALRLEKDPLILPTLFVHALSIKSEESKQAVLSKLNRLENNDFGALSFESYEQNRWHYSHSDYIWDIVRIALASAVVFEGSDLSFQQFDRILYKAIVREAESSSFTKNQFNKLSAHIDLSKLSEESLDILRQRGFESLEFISEVQNRVAEILAPVGYATKTQNIK